MVFSRGFKWFVFFLVTAVFGGTVLWMFLWSASGQLYVEGFKGLLWRYAFLLVPCIINVVLAEKYNADADGMDMRSIAISINFFLPALCAIGAWGELFGISYKLYCILEIAIPLGITYIMCLQCIIFAEEPVKSNYVPKHDNTEEVIKLIKNKPQAYNSEDPNKDADAVGLASGRGIK